MILMLKVVLHHCSPAVLRSIVTHQLPTAPLLAYQKLVLSRVKTEHHLLVLTTHLQMCTLAHNVTEIAEVEERLFHRRSPVLKMCSHDVSRLDVSSGYT